MAAGRKALKIGELAQCRFHHPQGLAIRNRAIRNPAIRNPAIRNLSVNKSLKNDLAANGTELYGADTENHLIRLVNFKTKTVSTLAGASKQAHYPTSGGSATHCLVKFTMGPGFSRTKAIHRHGRLPPAVGLRFDTASVKSPMPALPRKVSSTVHWR